MPGVVQCGKAVDPGEAGGSLREMCMTAWNGFTLRERGPRERAPLNSYLIHCSVSNPIALESFTIPAASS